MSRHAAVVFLVLLYPTVAAADSDGYYCAGRGYLAYELSLSTSSPGHFLHVVRYSRAGGVIALPPVRLEDFQVHGMRCLADRVELAGWTTRYSVGISGNELRVMPAQSAAYDPRAAPQVNLGHWSREGITDLDSDGSPGEFQLAIARTSRPVPGGLEHFTLTHLIRRELVAGGRILQSLELFEGVFLETID